MLIKNNADPTIAGARGCKLCATARTARWKHVAVFPRDQPQGESSEYDSLSQCTATAPIPDVR